MAYTDFTLESAEAELGVTCRPGVVFPDLRPAPVPTWLTDQLARGMQLALVSEKARSEFIVAPLLLAVRESAGGASGSAGAGRGAGGSSVAVAIRNTGTSKWAR